MKNTLTPLPTKPGAWPRTIRALVDAGYYRWGDFLILTARRKEISAYTAALESMRIPVETSGGTPGDSLWRDSLWDPLAALGDPG